MRPDNARLGEFLLHKALEWAAILVTPATERKKSLA